MNTRERGSTSEINDEKSESTSLITGANICFNIYIHIKILGDTEDKLINLHYHLLAITN